MGVGGGSNRLVLLDKWISLKLLNNFGLREKWYNLEGNEMWKHFLPEHGQEVCCNGREKIYQTLEVNRNAGHI